MKEYRTIIIAAVLSMCLFSANSYAASEKDHEATMVIPARVVQEFINEVLPFELTGYDKVSGLIRIKSVEQVKLGLNTVWFTTAIQGENITYEGDIGGLPANVRLGDLDSTLHCESSIRYDAGKRLLYLRPKAAEQAEKGNALLMVLVSLLSGKEYPIEIRKFKPIAAKISDKTLEIDMEISNIYTANDGLFIVMRPTVKAKQMDTAK